MKTTIIGIAGGTASGKTTLAKVLYEQTKENVVLLRTDDYYLGKEGAPKTEDGMPNFDHPNAYDVPLIVKNLKDLKDGKIIEKPTYDFVTSTRKQETETLYPAKVIIVEGIMILAIKEIRKLLDIKIYVDTDDDIRFIRRIKRDIEDRGRTLDSVINQYLKTVRPMHETFVEPSKKYADIIIPEGGKNKIAQDLLNTMIEKIQK